MLDRAWQAWVHTLHATASLSVQTHEGTHARGDESGPAKVKYVVTRATYDKMVQSMSTELGKRVTTASGSVKQMSAVANKVLELLVVQWVENVARKQIPHLNMPVAPIVGASGAGNTPSGSLPAAMTPGPARASATETPATRPRQEPTLQSICDATTPCDAIVVSDARLPDGARACPDCIPTRP